MRTSLADNQSKRAQLEAQLQTLSKQIEDEEKQSARLSGEIASESEEVAFLEAPPRTILDVSNASSFLIDFAGTKRFVILHGLSVDESKDTAITKVFRKRFIKKPIFVRCADAFCAFVYLYVDKNGSSLNMEMVKANLATAAAGARYDLASYSPQINPSPTVTSTSSQSSASSGSTAGKDVHVKGYTRKDGTYVPPHTRSAPGTKSRKP